MSARGRSGARPRAKTARSPAQGQSAGEHEPPGGVHTPQLALQHTSPTLQVFIPHGTLTGTVGPSQRAREQVAPGAVQIPQLALQHT